jgi:hypothetical protein
MKTSESIKELATALAKAQAGIRHATEDAKNPHFGSSYATLASVWDACRSQLAQHGIAVVQAPEADGATIHMTTMLLHSSGEWISSTLSVTATKADAQGVGSVITYARRYGLAAMVGVAPGDDDDANAAVEVPRTKVVRPTVKRADRDPKVRKAEAIAWIKARFPKQLSEKLGEILGRPIPEKEEDITFKSLGELETVEKWITLAGVAMEGQTLDPAATFGAE